MFGFVVVNADGYQTVIIAVEMRRHIGNGLDCSFELVYVWTRYTFHRRVWNAFDYVLSVYVLCLIPRGFHHDI